jgi:hypothetical protein
MNTISLENPDDFYHKIYHESCSEFEEVRNLCLSEDGWLKEIYTPKNLILENHIGYSVIFTKKDHEPVGMAGLFNDGRYPANVARQLHREYLFPKFRQSSLSGLTGAFKLYYIHVVIPLNTIKNFDLQFVAVQNRYKKKTKGYWKVFSTAACNGMPGWKLGNGYIQTCNADVQKCWQNYIYYESSSELWENWNKKIIDQEHWDNLIPGD